MKFINDPDAGVFIPDYEQPDDEDASNVESVEEYDDSIDGSIGNDVNVGLPVPGEVEVVSQDVSTAADGTQVVTVRFNVDVPGGYFVEARLV